MVLPWDAGCMLFPLQVQVKPIKHLQKEWFVFSPYFNSVFNYSWKLSPLNTIRVLCMNVKICYLWLWFLGPYLCSMIYMFSCIMITADVWFNFIWNINKTMHMRNKCKCRIVGIWFSFFLTSPYTYSPLFVMWGCHLQWMILMCRCPYINIQKIVWFHLSCRDISRYPLWNWCYFWFLQ